jgi:hypothetical protein
MFRHLKPEEFINLVEGTEVPVRHRAHIDSCQRCAALLKAVGAAHSGVVNAGMDIPEPDWHEFRSSVRDELLSRSIQRESSRRWTGWPLRPVAAWALSIVIAVGFTTGGFLWHIGRMQAQLESPNPNVESGMEPSIEPTTIGAEIETWLTRDVFEDLSQLKDEQQDQLRELLQSSQEEWPSR